MICIPPAQVAVLVINVCGHSGSWLLAGPLQPDSLSDCQRLSGWLQVDVCLQVEGWLAGGSHNPALPERQYTWYQHSGLLCPSETRSQVITPWLAQSVTEAGPSYPSALRLRDFVTGSRRILLEYTPRHTRARAAWAMNMRFDAIAKKIKLFMWAESTGILN